MTFQEENAAIILSHSRIRPELIPHDGSTIANLIRIVEKRVPPADDAVCAICECPYEEHGGLDGWCPNIWDEDSDWSHTRRFAER